MSFHRLLCIFVFVTLHAALSSASIYPTTPISKTVFTAGQPAKLKWMEDGRPPLLRDTGRVKIQLFAGNETFLATLARNVQPQVLSRTVYIPPIIPLNYNTYTIRFVPAHSNQTIYTADFKIIPNPFSHLLNTAHLPTSSPTPVSAMSNSPTESPAADPAQQSTVPSVSRISGTQTQPPFSIVSASGADLPDASFAFFGFTFGYMSIDTFRVHATKSPGFRLLYILPTLVGLLLSM